MKKIPLIAIVGSTASGKTEAGLAIARAVGGEVLCVDSRTVYRGMDIGTAKSQAFGIDLVNPDELFTAADFVVYAKKIIDGIAHRGNIPVLVGGTGLYFRALLDGLTLTNVEPDAALRTELDAMSTEALAEMLGELDHDGASSIDANNRRRLIRAIEIVRTTGEPLAVQQRKIETPYDVCWLGMDVPRVELFARINRRVDAMIAEGLVDEVRGLLAKYGAESRAMSGIGYRQLAEFFNGKISLAVAVDHIKTATRRYAKRQLTWFKADKRVQWVKDAQVAVMLAKNFVMLHGRNSTG